jgi:hypothetical protein
LALLSSKMLPTHPEAIEAARVPLFDMSSESPLPRASPAINSDMVKPMPGPYGHVAVPLSLSALMIYHSPWIVV